MCVASCATESLRLKGITQPAHLSAENIPANTMKILIIDDEATHRALLEDILSKWPEHKVTSVASGQAALDLLKTNGYGFDVVFLDVKMPGLSGLEVLQQLNESPLHRSLEIVMCSTFDDMPTIRKSLELGARHYMVKPATEKSVRKKLQQIARIPDVSVS